MREIEILAYFLAVDAGGTKTRCVLADETRVLARASTGTVKLMRVSEAEATTRLKSLLAEVSAAAGVDLSEVKQSCVGMGGVAIPAVQEWTLATMGAVVGGEIELCGDEHIALDAAFKGGPGILVVAGTGVIVAGRSTDGTIYGTAGFGPILGDEGSGYWIGLEGIKAGLWARDREMKTSLLTEIQAFWGLNSVGELLEKGNARPGPDFAALCPTVVRCAENGDELAEAVLRRAGTELAEPVALMAVKMMETSDASDSEIGVAYTGSVLEHIALVRESMIAALRKSTPHAKVIEGAADSLEGALWRARNAV
jgi:N-acetylglucosamine kinase-like BadF-type ATPase